MIARGKLCFCIGVPKSKALPAKPMRTMLALTVRNCARDGTAAGAAGDASSLVAGIDRIKTRDAIYEHFWLVFQEGGTGKLYSN